MVLRWSNRCSGAPYAVTCNRIGPWKPYAVKRNPISQVRRPSDRDERVFRKHQNATTTHGPFPQLLNIEFVSLLQNRTYIWCDKIFLIAVVESLWLPLPIDIIFTTIELVVEFCWILMLAGESRPNFTKTIMTTAPTLTLQTTLIHWYLWSNFFLSLILLTFYSRLFFIIHYFNLFLLFILSFF